MSEVPLNRFVRRDTVFGLGDAELISQKEFMKLLCNRHIPYKSVNLFFMLVIVKDNLTNLCGN